MMSNKKQFLSLILILIFLLSFFNINITIGEKINYWTWAYAYGSKNADKANHIIITDDGNYLVFGETFFKNSTDFFLLKIDKKGEILWSKRYTAPKPEIGITLGEIIQTKDGGYIFTNTSKSFGKGDQNDIVVVKLDKNGNIEWSKVLLDNEDQGVWGIIQTKDGGFLVGSCGKYLNLYKIHLIKLDSNGNFLWGKRFEYSNYRDVGVFLLEDSKGNILISGRSYKEDSSHPILIKLDKNGNLAWTRIFNLGKSINSGNKIIEAHDNGYIIVGYTNSFGAGDQDLIVFKVDENGDLSWAKTYGSEKYEHAFYISKFDDGYAISSLTNSYRLGYDVLYFTIDKNGDLIWSKRFGGSKDNELDYRYGTIFQTKDKGFVLVSFSNSFGNQGYEIVVLKTDNNGNIENCPYIKEAKIIIKDIKKSLIVEKPSYNITNINWQIKDANFTVSDAGFTRTTIFEVKPTTPKLISPQNGDVIKENLILSWKESINSLNYEIEISEDENFKNVIYKKLQMIPKLKFLLIYSKIKHIFGE